MDLSFLLSLQEFREAGGQWLAPVMQIVSVLGSTLPMLIPIVVFWTSRREDGYWYMLNIGIATFINNILKLVACVYRPWVRNSEIRPWEAALSDATGYSFPSIHATNSAAVFGAVGIRQWKKRKWLSLAMFLLVALVAFSRNYLGVHTPQDVLVGIAVAFLVIVFNTWLIRHLAGNEKRQDIWTAAGFIFVIACILVIEFKSYPMDYGADGTLIVDPQAMKKDAYMAAGTVLGFLAGSLWERKRIRFDASGTVREKVIRCVIGLVPAAGIYLGIRKLLAGWIGVNVGNLVGMFLLAFFVVGVYPWCAMKMKEKKSGARAS